MNKKTEKTSTGVPPSARLIKHFLESEDGAIEFVGGIMSALVVFSSKEGALTNFAHLAESIAESTKWKEKLGKDFAPNLIRSLWNTVLTEFSVKLERNFPKEIAEAILSTDFAGHLDVNDVKEILLKFDLEASSKEVAKQLESKK